jgi:chemotaxis-related protein WspB
MAALLFEIDGQRYGLDIAQVLKVVPAVPLRRIPQAPDYVAGILRYQNMLVPVIDLSQLIAGRPARNLLSTRMILVQYPGPAGMGRTLGLLAERATDSLDSNSSAAVPSGFAVPEAPYLGGLSTIGDSMIQYVRVEHLLSEELRDRLFTEQ